MTSIERVELQQTNGIITPEEAARVRAAVGKREQTPSTRQQSMLFANWREAADQLGSPFEVERIPLSKLRAMRRDPILGFGSSFIKTPHVRAQWHIDARSSRGADPKVAAHLDHDLRRIYGSLQLQALNALDFGFQAVGKRFEFRVPAATYIEIDPETGEQTERPAWDEGNIEPIAWKPFIALPPEGVEPIWTNDGEFDGINFRPATAANAPRGVAGAKRRPGGEGQEDSWDIDIYHALWFTNERDQNFGSLFGYPRLGYAYRFWWSYWFRWAIADRAFEKKADPSIVVRHPDGEFVDQDTGERMSYSEYALLMGERMRSGGVIALPSEPYEDANGRGTMPQWSIEFTKEATNFEPFDKSFEYLDVQKLRSLAIPEQAFFEGKGGTSSRNVAAEMGESFMESQGVLSEQNRHHINRWVIPQWLAVNYPEFVLEGGRATLIVKGFADQDVEFTKQIIQLIGQQEDGAREIAKLVDLKRVLEEAGTPIASFEEQKRRELEIAKQVAQTPPPVVEPIPGGVGVVPTATGFSYVAGREVIHLADSGSDFIQNLPPSAHYEDRTIKGFTRQLWTTYRDLYADEYETIIAAIENGDEPLLDDVEASIEANFNEVELALPKELRRAARALRNLPGSRLWSRTLDRTSMIFEKIARRAAKIELSRAGLKAKPDDEEVRDFLRDHIAEFATKTAETTRNEVRNFVAKLLDQGIQDRVEIARRAREHFEGFPLWKADRLVRTEVRNVYNAATILAARAAGVGFVQAVDAQYGPTDQDCMDRDGQLFTVTEALKEDEHPNGTLAWQIVPVENLSIAHVDDVGGDYGARAVARYDSENETIYLANWAPKDKHNRFLKVWGDAIRAR